MNCYILLSYIFFKSDGEYALNLKQVELPILRHDECNQAFRASRLGKKFSLHKSMLCAGGEHAEDTCKGDGGGPLVCPSNDNPNTYIQVCRFIFLLRYDKKHEL